MSSLKTPAALLTPQERAADVVNMIRARWGVETIHIDILDAIAAAIADAERRGLELAAQVCDARAIMHGDRDTYFNAMGHAGTHDETANEEAVACVLAIRDLIGKP